MLAKCFFFLFLTSKLALATCYSFIQFAWENLPRQFSFQGKRLASESISYRSQCILGQARRVESVLHRYTNWIHTNTYIQILIVYEFSTLSCVACVAGSFDSFGAHQRAAKPRGREGFSFSPPHSPRGFARSRALQNWQSPGYTLCCRRRRASQLQGLSLLHSLLPKWKRNLEQKSFHITFK